MKRGDIIFVRGDSIISKIINKVDKGEFSHVAIALSDTTILEAQRFTESRIVKNYLENYDIIDLGLDEIQREKAIDAALDLIGYDYDYSQIVSTFFNNVFKIARRNNRSKYICSELAVDFLFKVGAITADERELIHHYTANELYKYLMDGKCVKYTSWKEIE